MKEALSHHSKTRRFARRWITYTSNKINITIWRCSIELKPYEGVNRIETAVIKIRIFVCDVIYGMRFWSSLMKCCRMQTPKWSNEEDGIKISHSLKLTLKDSTEPVFCFWKSFPFFLTLSSTWINIKDTSQSTETRHECLDIWQNFINKETITENAMLDKKYIKEIASNNLLSHELRVSYAITKNSSKLFIVFTCTLQYPAFIFPLIQQKVHAFSQLRKKHKHLECKIEREKYLAQAG